MKKTLALLTLLSTLLFTQHSSAADVIGGLAWDASPSPGVTLYIVYTTPIISANAGVFPDGWTVLGVVNAPTTNFGGVIFDGLPHAYVVTAKGASGFESDPSNSVDAPLKPLPVGDLRIIIP